MRITTFTAAGTKTEHNFWAKVEPKDVRVPTFGEHLYYSEVTPEREANPVHVIKTPAGYTTQYPTPTLDEAVADFARRLRQYTGQAYFERFGGPVH